MLGCDVILRVGLLVESWRGPPPFPPRNSDSGSVQSVERLGRRVDLRDDSAEILFQSFLQEALVNSFGTGRDVHSHVDHPAFPLLTTASPTLKGALKNSSGEVVMVCDMPESLKFPSFESCLERLLWCVTCPHYLSFHLFTVASSGSCGLTRKLIMIHNQSLVLCSR